MFVRLLTKIFSLLLRGWFANSFSLSLVISSTTNCD